MKDILLGAVYIIIAIWLFVVDKVSLGYMSPTFEGMQKNFITGLLVLFGFIQIFYGYKKNIKKK